MAKSWKREGGSLPEALFTREGVGEILAVRGCDDDDNSYRMTMDLSPLADEMVRRYNAHSALVAALELALARWGKLEGSGEIGMYDTGKKTGEIIKAALALAKEPS